MADSSKLVPFILSWETDRYTNNKKDKGGPTKYGITLATWRRVGYDKNGDGAFTAADDSTFVFQDGAIDTVVELAGLYTGVNAVAAAGLSRSWPA